MMLTSFSVRRLLSRLFMTQRIRCIPLCGCIFLSLCCSLHAAPVDQVAFFEEHIRPLLHTHCSECHGAEKQESGLRVDQRAHFFAGGDSGPIFSSENVDQSLFLKAIRYDDELQMPPEHPLPSNAVALLTRWVKMGAPWPEDSDVQSESSPLARMEQIQRSHWSLQSVLRPAIPAVQQMDWPRNAIDYFILARQEEVGLTPSPRANPAQLLRRAAFDLTGLPPTLQEREHFLPQEYDLQWTALIDYLLDRPEYGQRWARHWLDVARYADTKGYIGVGKREERYAYAWTYRDYVVRALNEDVPFDDFIRHQLAADLLDLAPDEQWKLAAMGFLTLGNRFIHKRHRIVGDQIDVTMRGFQGLTLMCARCHDHKFDPIAMEDYYGLYGIFDSSVEPSYDAKPLLSEEPSEEDKQYAEFKKTFSERINKYHKRRHALRKQISQEMRSFVGEYLEYVVHETMPTHRTKTDLNYKTDRVLLRRHNLVADGGVVLWTRYLADHKEDPVFGIWHQFAELGREDFGEQASRIIQRAKDVNPQLLEALKQDAPQSMLDVAETYGEVLESIDAKWQAIMQVDPGDAGFEDQTDEQLRQVLYGPDSPAVVESDEQAQNLYHIKENNDLRSLDQMAQNTVVQFIETVPPRAMTLTDRKEPRDAVIHLRGDWRRKGQETERRFLKMLSGDFYQGIDSGSSYNDGSGRLQLAEAIASPHNPLTARVIVNRVWQWHFGDGLVPTPSDFGTRSPEPLHRELLDYLAAYLMENDWSLKALHRLILDSATYQQASVDDVEKRTLDPGNAYYWRMNRRRLEFEAMRDSLLAATGEIQTHLGGLPTEDFNSPRRSLYLLVNRQQMPGVLATFDVSVPDATLPLRNKTTVPQQALYLMNNRFIAERAAEIIQRLDAAEPTATESPDMVRQWRVAKLYDWVYGRQPTDVEKSLASQFLNAPLLDQPQSLQPDEKQTVWEYGTGKINSDSGEVSFTPLPYFDGYRWREKKRSLSQPYLDATGGRPGKTRAVIRRFTAPEDGLYLFKGRVNLRLNSERGDGISIHVVSSRQGELGQYQARNKEERIRIEKIEVKQGEQIDFVVSAKQDNRFDTYHWPIEVWKVRVMKNGELDGLNAWPSEPAFTASIARWTGPQTPWQQYAHALLISNEFMFVD
ncbi:MAG: PSD1 and planctomycete cytochrome C domain-containing protein [Pirellulales bacterium]|nr:PSD1 and planctomycete cytochrome C domain-containing protein [Pirellulales bacterium]